MKMASHSKLVRGGLPHFEPVALSYAYGKVKRSCIKSMEWLLILSLIARKRYSERILRANQNI